jgi:hypothetical protein
MCGIADSELVGDHALRNLSRSTSSFLTTLSILLIAFICKS